MRTMLPPNPQPGDLPSLPCIQPMAPQVKRLYVQVLIIISIVIVGVNLIRPLPAPPGCCTGFQV
ncbi:hypothetical protein [Massilia sp. TSP1-1-2]|uniref:hypothetical protein n=1 Tax=Massilia sp. TSP1-1-2 TaxID=2804649 RepID=UPI003CF8E764